MKAYGVFDAVMILLAIFSIQRSFILDGSQSYIVHVMALFNQNMLVLLFESCGRGAPIAESIRLKILMTLYCYI